MDVAVLLLLTAVVALSRHVNVAASCGVAALPGRPCGRALAGSGSAATTAGAVMVCSPESNGSQGLGALPGSGSGSGGQTDFGPALRTSAPGRTGSPAAVMAPGSSGNGSGTSSVGTTAGGAGSALAIYSLLVCAVSASSLFRGRPARSAIDPQEG
jgi:hypothetical protein